MKKFKISVVLIIILSIIFTPFVNAEEQCGSVSGEYKYGEEVIKDATVSLYLVANIDDTGIRKYEFTDNFKEYELRVNDLAYSELSVYASNLKKAIKSGNVQKVATVKTDENGKFAFDECLYGLYLIDVEDLQIGRNLYKALPSIAELPILSETGAETYEVNASVKSEKSEVAVSSGSNIRVPNTYDEIIFYVALFIISLVLLVILICYINNKKKKGNEKNEKIK